MGITLNTILQFTGSDRVLLNAQGTGLESVNRLQRFKSFFNIGDARQKNAETLTAIHHAVLNDPRFASKELQDQAVRLLSEVRVDRALDATRIRKIAQDLDGLVAAYDKRVELCLAATPLRGYLEDYASEVREIVQFHVRDAAGTALAAGANAGPLDVARLVKEAVEACENAILSVAVRGHRPDPFLMRMVGQNLRAFIVRGDNTLRSMDEVTTRVRQSSDFFRCVQTYANQRFMSGVFPTGAESEAAKGKKAHFELAALDFLGGVQRPVPPEAFDLIQDFVARVPLYDLSRLNGSASADEIFEILHNYAAFMHERQILKADGNPLFISDPTAAKALGIYLARLVVMKLPESVRQGIFEALESPAGARALARIDHDAVDKHSALSDYLTVRTFIQSLEPTVGREGWYADKFEKPVRGRHGMVRSSLDLTGFSTAARTVYAPDSSFTGRAADRLGSALLSPLAAAMSLSVNPDPAGAFRRRISGGVRTVLDGVFADTMRSLATNARSVAPAANVTLPGGDALPADPVAARDRLARLATGRDDAVYANLSAADRARTDVLLVLLSSDVGEAAEKGISAALAVDRGHETFRADGGDVVRRFAVTGSAAEGFHIRCEVHRTPQSVTLAPDGSAARETIAAGDGSFVDTQLDLFFTPDDLTRLAGRDWDAYDPAAFNSAFVGDPLSLAALDGTVQQDFRLGGDMAAAFQVNLNPAVAGT